MGLGLSDGEIAKVLAAIEAIGEINNIPAPRLGLILAKARTEMEGPPPPFSP